MRKIIVLFLVFSVLSLSVNLMAKERRGADIMIQKKDGQQVKGELIAVKQTSLLLKESSSSADVTAVVSDMKTIIIVKKSKALEQGGLGLLVGGTTGAAAGGAYVYTINFFGIFGQFGSGDYSDYALRYGLICGAIGALIGVMTGASVGKDEIIQIEGKPEAEIKKTMEDLRKKARVPDFQ